MILALETSDILCSVAFWDKGQKLVEYNHELARQHASLIGDLVDNGLTFLSDPVRKDSMSIDDIKLVCVAIGPGSFTGLRIGLSYAQGFCLGRGLAVCGISNHQLLAFQGAAFIRPIFTLIEARQDEVYVAEHDFTDYGYPLIINHEVISKQKLAGRFPNRSQVLCSRNLKLPQEFLEPLEQGGIILNQNVSYSAGILAELGHLKQQHSGPDELDTLEPMYIRPFAGVK